MESSCREDQGLPIPYVKVGNSLWAVVGVGSLRVQQPGSAAVLSVLRTFTFSRLAVPGSPTLRCDSFVLSTCLQYSKIRYGQRHLHRAQCHQPAHGLRHYTSVAKKAPNICTGPSNFHLCKPFDLQNICDNLIGSILLPIVTNDF